MAVPIKNKLVLKSDWTSVVADQICFSPSRPVTMPVQLADGPRPVWPAAPTLQPVWPVEVVDQASNASLEIVVLHTNPKETPGALKMAGTLANDLAPIRLLVAQTVPYPLPLEAPPVSVEFLEDRTGRMVSEAGINVSVDIRLGRDAGDVIEAGVGPHSVIVIGGRRRWWPTATMRLARRLERLGHQVVFANGKYTN